MRSKNNFNPGENLLGNFHELDGTIEFYGRINAILKDSDSVLDLGAGRGSWYSLDKCSYRREIRNLKKKVKYLVGIDIDDAVLENPTTHKNMTMSLNKIPLENNSMDIIVADWVLEHVQNPTEFTSEIDRVLKPGGIFCARTPHKYKYVSIPPPHIKLTGLPLLLNTSLNIQGKPICGSIEQAKQIANDNDIPIMFINSSRWWSNNDPYRPTIPEMSFDKK